MGPGSVLLVGLTLCNPADKGTDPSWARFQEPPGLYWKAFLQLANSHASFPDLPLQPHAHWPPLLISHTFFWVTPCPVPCWLELLVGSKCICPGAWERTEGRGEISLLADPRNVRCACLSLFLCFLIFTLKEAESLKSLDAESPRNPATWRKRSWASDICIPRRGGLGGILLSPEKGWGTDMCCTTR